MKKEVQLNTSYLDQMSGHDPATRLELLLLLAEELRTRPPSMRQCWEKQDLPALRRLSHHYKSTLPFTGCGPLIDANRKLEERLKESPQSLEIPLLLLQIEKASAAILLQVEALIRQASSTR
ncbi:MAG TPA: hypothetical protein VJ933_10865 [Phaeodactylibacter sp.]|nr:hypothetical protein [Phaeodactylibacter sp.]